jgi:hypothetical protein
MAEWKAQPYVIVRVGTLDDDPGNRAVAHIWMSHHAPWLSDDPAIRTYAEGSPPKP